MLTGWVTNLDRLAAEGVIDYDAAANVGGFAPRYVGAAPEHYALNPFPGGVPQMKTQPDKDSLLPQESEPFSSPSWKKWLLVFIGIGLLEYGGFKAFKLFSKKAKTGAPVGIFRKGWTKTKDFFAGLAGKVKKVFKK